MPYSIVLNFFVGFFGPHLSLTGINGIINFLIGSTRFLEILISSDSFPIFSSNFSVLDIGMI